MVSIAWDDTKTDGASNLPAAEYNTMVSVIKKPVPCNYIVYLAGSIVKAFNCETNIVDYSNTYINDTVNSCINAATLGGKILLKTGLYFYDDVIDTGTKQITIEGDIGSFDGTYTTNALELRAAASGTANDYIIKSGSAVTATNGLVLKNLCLDGRQYTNLLGGIYWRNILNSRIENCKIMNLYGDSPMAYGINIEGDAGLGAYYNTLMNLSLRRDSCGIRLGTLANANTLINTKYDNTRSGTPILYGLWLDNCDTTAVYGSGDFEGFNSINSIALYITDNGPHRFFGLRFEGNYNNIQIDAGAGTGNNIFYGMNISNVVSGGTAVIDNGNQPSVFDGCVGYKTENWGSSTGTGAQQTIAHGLAATPTLVLLSDKEAGANAYQSATADATNIYVLAVVNQNYQWYVRV